MTKAIILCAGEGTRLLPLTKNIPKPMIPIKGHPLLEYNIMLCKKNDIKEIFINTSYLPEKIKKYFRDGRKWGVKIKYSYEKNLLGTAGALKNFEKDLKGEAFVVIYGDNLTNLNLKEMIKSHKEKTAFATLFIYREKISDKESTPGIIVVNKKKKVKKIIENPSTKEVEELRRIPESKKYINAGVYIFNPKIFNYINKSPSDFSKDIFPKIIKFRKKIFGFTSPCFFRELGSKERYNLTEKEISNNKINLDLLENEK